MDEPKNNNKEKFYFQKPLRMLLFVASYSRFGCAGFFYSKQKMAAAGMSPLTVIFVLPSGYFDSTQTREILHFLPLNSEVKHCSWLGLTWTRPVATGCIRGQRPPKFSCSQKIFF